MAAGGKTFIHLPIYVTTCLSIDLLQILNIHTELIILLACIYIDLYGYTDSLIRIRSAGWQLTCICLSI